MAGFALQRALTRSWTRRGWLAWLLSPVALVFRALVAFRRSLFRIGLLKIRRVSVPVIVVGNVVAGGSGKTPVVIALVLHLQSSGLRVGVISRGYGRLAKDCREVLAGSAIAEVGDEPELIRRATKAKVFVASNRFEAACQLLRRYPDTQVIVCDDGLQHLALHRDLEICIFDDRGVGNGFLLPAGPLREPWPRVVDLVLHTGAQPAFAGFTTQRTLAQSAQFSDGSTMALSELADASVKPLMAVAGIAKPEDFFTMLQSQGLPLAKVLALPDHFDFKNWSSNEYDNYSIVCTEKDAVKLWQHQPDALAVPLVVKPEIAFMCKLDALLSALLPGQISSRLSSNHGHTTS
jgi:tetraacyldisaccharide 4'-kinase